MKASSALPRLGRPLLSAGLAALCTSVQASEGYAVQDLAQLTCAQADKKLTEGIAAGSAEAAYTTAQMVIRRVCFKRDYAVYGGFLRTAADRGHKGAMRDLGYAHATGEGANQDYATAGELLRRSGETNWPDMDAYTYGYVWSLARMVRRYAGLSVPIWLTKDHMLRVTLVIDPLNLPPALTIRSPDEVPPELVDERKALIANFDDEMRGAVVKAVKALARPSADRLGSVKATFAWTVGFRRSANFRVTEELDLDQFRPR